MDKFNNNCLPVQIEEARNNEGLPQFVGYGAVYYDGTPKTEFVLWDNGKEKAVERIAPGAFHRSLTDGRVIDARFEHKADWTLDNTSCSLVLSEDGKGLTYRFSHDPSDPQSVTALAKVRKGLVKGSSFGFRANTTKSKWTVENGVAINTLTEIDLFEVSLVRSPAYQATTTGARSTEDIEQALRAYLDFQTEEKMKKLEIFLSNCNR